FRAIGKHRLERKCGDPVFQLVDETEDLLIDNFLEFFEDLAQLCWHQLQVYKSGESAVFLANVARGHHLTIPIDDLYGFAVHISPQPVHHYKSSQRSKSTIGSSFNPSTATRSARWSLMSSRSAVSMKPSYFFWI